MLSSAGSEKLVQPIWADGEHRDMENERQIAKRFAFRFTPLYY